LVQRPQRLLPRQRSAGDRAGHRLRAAAPHRRGPVRVHERRRRGGGDRGAGGRLRAPPARGARDRRAAPRLRPRARSAPGAPVPVTLAPTDAELREVLGGDDVLELSRRPYRYATSAPLEQLDVRLRDGTRLELILKELARERLMGDARATKPEFVYEPERELATYRELIGPAGVGPRFYGAGAAGWLVLEKVPGVEL